MVNEKQNEETKQKVAENSNVSSPEDQQTFNLCYNAAHNGDYQAANRLSEFYTFGIKVKKNEIVSNVVEK